MKVNTGNTPSITIGGITVSLDDSRYFLLYAGVLAGKYDSLASGSNVKYQVPAGKTLTLLAVKMNVTGPMSLTVGSSTAQVNNGTIPAGYALLHNTNYLLSSGASAPQQSEQLINLTVPQNLYVNIVSSGADYYGAVFLCKLT